MVTLQCDGELPTLWQVCYSVAGLLLCGRSVTAWQVCHQVVNVFWRYILSIPVVILLQYSSMLEKSANTKVYSTVSDVHPGAQVCKQMVDLQPGCRSKSGCKGLQTDGKSVTVWQGYFCVRMSTSRWQICDRVVDAHLGLQADDRLSLSFGCISGRGRWQVNGSSISVVCSTSCIRWQVYTLRLKI